MRFDVITIFPSMFEGPFSVGLIAKAREKKLIDLQVHDLRKFTDDAHRTVDDVPYGGGGGMVFKPEPVFLAVEQLAQDLDPCKRAVVLLTPRGRLLEQRQVEELSELEQIVIICGRYEGVDERVALHVATHEVSLGDFVLSGGEIPAMALIEAVSRLIPDVVGNPESVQNDSFSGSLLEYPHFTRPAVFRDYHVPEVLVSGNHQAIARYRRTEALRATLTRRPDLLDESELDEESRQILAELKRGTENEHYR